MENVANDPAATSPDLPAGRVRALRTGTLTHGLRVGEVLGVSTLAGARVLAGRSGLDRVVTRLNVMEVPDILPWVKPDELLLTTGYPLRNTPHALADLVRELDSRGLAALAIKLHRYIDELPSAMVEQADRLGFPIILLPDAVGFDDILNQVLTDILNRKTTILARSEEVHRALLEIVLAGGGLQEVCDNLVELLGGAVFATGTDGAVLARSGSGRALAAALAGPCFDPAGRLRVGVEEYGVATHRRLAGCHALVPVIAGSFDHGRIIAFSPDRPLGEMDVHTLERAATVAALVITKQLAVMAVESKYQTDFLHDLISGRAGGPGRAIAHSASLGWDIDRPVVVVVAELDPQERAAGQEPQRPLQERFAAAWHSAVRARDSGAAVVGFSREVVTVLGVPRGGGAGRLVRDIVAQVSAGSGWTPRPFSTGVSRVGDTPESIPGAYAQARRAVAVGRQMQGPGAVADFDGLGVFRLLSLVPDAGELQSFVEEALGALAVPDDPEAADLRRTLRVLLQTNLNVAESARVLHFHYNTLRYRIGKLERMIGPFTSDANLRLNVTLALRVLQLRGL
ncbi:MAG: PucR family transcriptional regulator [Carbonactinosporaceae bacterium]